jgi:type IV pilus assembly protein PilB
MAVNLGDLLVAQKVISAEQLQYANKEQKSKGGKLITQLVSLNIVDENKLIAFLSNQYGIPCINLDEFELEPNIVKLVPKEIVEKHSMIPVNKAGSSLIVAVSDPSNLMAIDDLKFITGYNIEVVVAAESAIKGALAAVYKAAEAQDVNYDDLISDFDDTGIELVTEEDEDQGPELSNVTADAPVVKFVNFILSDAIKRRVSDIHVEPFEKSLRVRYRIDGVLYDVHKPPFKLKNAIVSRLKIMSELDIAERRLPQDGRIKLKLGRRSEMDFRISIMPTIYGEKCVLRLLDKSALQVDMTKLGFEESALQAFQDAIKRPYGIILVTGPTGSGKTTTLYSALHELNKAGTNISTAEDPVEYNLHGINQVQMHEDIGLTFATAMRAFFRQDPDVIMVGEIRDFETAEISIKASLTGHLVLSTIHTNDAPGTIHRLLNMGIEPFLVASSIILVVAQRLIRINCDNCREEVQVADQVLLNLGVPADKMGTFKVFKGRGCEICSNTGYKRRVGIYEVMAVNEEIKEFIVNGASHAEIKREAIRLGMMTLRKAAVLKLIQGLTTTEEIIRVSVVD